VHVSYIKGEHLCAVPNTEDTKSKRCSGALGQEAFFAANLRGLVNGQFVPAAQVDTRYLAACGSTWPCCAVPRSLP